MEQGYVPLMVKTNFSFLEGASHPEELVAEARGLGLPAVAITDRDGVHGIVRAHVAALEQGQRLLIGSQVTVAQRLPVSSQGEPLTAVQVRAATVAQPVLLAMDRAGYGNLCRLVTWGRRRCAKGASLVTWGELADLSEGLVLLHHQPLATPAPGLRDVADAFADRAYALVLRHLEPTDAQRERHLRTLARELGWPCVAGTEVLYHSPSRRALQDVLTCIRQGTTLHAAGRLLHPNAEHGLLSPHAFAQRFEDAPDLVVRTLEIAGRCRFAMAELRYRYPAEHLPGGTTLSDWLRHLVEQGALARYGGRIPADVRVQIDKELDLIGKLDYGGYFLTMWEIVEFCRSRQILCQGRGSAANSVVCYCLGITAIDPVRMGLLFERFLSLERAEPPDIDLDIEHERREEVIQHMYARYDPLHVPPTRSRALSSGGEGLPTGLAPCVTDPNRSHAAMVANVIRYRSRSAVRDVGKVLGLAETELDRLARFFSHHGDGMAESVLREAGLDPTSAANQLLMQLVDEIQDFPRHLSIHPGGFLLGHEPVDSLVPIENATMEGRTVVQWDKDDVEALGLFKVDLLGLGMLTQIHRCFALIAGEGGQRLSMKDVPAEDPAVYAMISRSDTVGVFQIESRAQMSMLPRMQPRTFYDLVIEVAIIRPGPISGGMVHPFLRRREGLEPVVYPHPCLEPILAKTLGVPLFQEQVMKLAMAAADYTPGEADQLRRDMAAWRRTGRMDLHRVRLLDRMTKKGIDLAFAERVFEQLRGFGEYGFPESHAASFALIAYVSAWLKCHHPEAFACALLNSQPMGFYSPATIIEDARRHGVTFLPIDVQHSSWDCALVPVEQGEPHVRMGLRYVKGLGELHRERLGQAPYRDLTDFVRKTRLDRKALDALAEADAFAGLGLSRREALWQARALQERAHEALDLVQHEDLPLFQALTAHEGVLWDYRRTSHSPRGHPLEHLRPELRQRGLPTATEVAAMPDGRRVRYVGLVICRQRPGTAKGVTFFTMEDETGFANLVLWRDVFEKFQLLARTAGVVGVTGRVQAQGGVVHIVVQSLWAVTFQQPVEPPRARDFH
jgi:error-prone DNA polymerase